MLLDRRLAELPYGWGSPARTPDPLAREGFIVRKLGVRFQRTLRHEVTIDGPGLLSGRPVRLRLKPAPANTGHVFLRVDLPTPAVIPAQASLVTDTHRRTTLGLLPHGVTLVEHVLSALHGMGVDNCYIEVNAPEPPGLDGSSWSFAEAIRNTGTRPQRARRTVWTVSEPISVQAGSARIEFHPAERDELRISYFLDYGPTSPIPTQRHSQVITPESYFRDIAPCRTFLLESEAHDLHRAGVGLHLTPMDLLVFGNKGLIDNVPRFPNEPARHKILDILGDIALFGREVRGHIVAHRSGHPLNAELVRCLLQCIDHSRKPLRDDPWPRNGHLTAAARKCPLN